LNIEEKLQSCTGNDPRRNHPSEKALEQYLRKTEKFFNGKRFNRNCVVTNNNNFAQYW